MYNIRPRSRYAGMTVKTKPDVGSDPLSHIPLGNQDFEVEDWWENVYGLSWMHSNGNFAALAYAMRTGLRHGAVPLDDNVLYGKIMGMGFLFHLSELCLPEEETTNEP